MDILFKFFFLLYSALERNLISLKEMFMLALPQLKYQWQLQNF